VTSTKAIATRLLLAAAWGACATMACSGDTPNAAYTVIDDMEGTSGLIEWKPPTAVAPAGGWTSYAETECDHLLPIPGVWSYEPLPAPYATLPGITSAHAARMRTTAPLDNTWGAAMGFYFYGLLPPSSGAGASNLPPTCPPGNGGFQQVKVDLTAYTGITFWGMATEGAGATTLSVRIDDRNTDSSGGRCDPSMPSNPLTSCFNSFRSTVELTSAFKQYTIDFSQFQQGAFGFQLVPSVLDQQNVFELTFQVRTPGGYCSPPTICAGPPPTLTFDIWIDDLYFVDK
jgi:hypothetical protein